MCVCVLVCRFTPLALAPAFVYVVGYRFHHRAHRKITHVNRPHRELWIPSIFFHRSSIDCLDQVVVFFKEGIIGILKSSTNRRWSETKKIHFRSQKQNDFLYFLFCVYPLWLSKIQNNTHLCSKNCDSKARWNLIPPGPKSGPILMPNNTLRSIPDDAGKFMILFKVVHTGFIHQTLMRLGDLFPVRFTQKLERTIKW